MKKPPIPTPVITAILTLITIFFWAGFEVFRSLTVKPAPPVPEAIIMPLDPTLDTKTLDEIAARNLIDDSQIGNIQIAVSSSPSPTPTASPVATTSASPSPSPTPAP